MLQRLAIHFSLILLFAFTQMGVATHAVSHFTDGHEQHQQDQNNQDKNNHENQCGQCISLNHIADADDAQAFAFVFNTVAHSFVASTSTNFKARTLRPYTARGPPVTSQI